MAAENNKPNAGICVVLPAVPGWSETFLRAHVDRLGATVHYLDQFPIDVDAAFGDRTTGKPEWIKRNVRVATHRYIFNTIKGRNIRKFFRADNTIAVLAEYGLTGMRVMETCCALNIPMVVHFHGYDAYVHQLLERHHGAYRKMFTYSSALIAVSTHMADQLIKLGAPPDKVIYNPCGVEVDEFKPALPGSALQVISVGRFVEKKAPYLTILAFKKVLERLPSARLVMVGTGLLHDVCSKMIAALHLEDAVELKGMAEHGEIAAWLQQSRVFVQHSLVPESGDMEGTPVAVLEAGASGLPVVATRHGGISDAVIHEETGFLVAEGDIDAMAEYIYLLLTNPELAGRMGLNARKRICESFSQERSINALRGILERVVRNRSDRSDLHQVEFVQ